MNVYGTIRYSKKSKNTLYMTFGARPKYGARREYYEEGGGENDTIVDLQTLEMILKVGEVL